MNQYTLAILTFLLTLPHTRTLAFFDTQNHWGKDCLQQLGERKLITGYPDGSFRPNATVTRAEAAVLMLNAFPDAPIIMG
ncbi:S-layer homology domain-containing protein [Nodularia sp. NIES-3585]|uniref:S-layer homology domain-containing protein n=1 Tax=Nodularia sp. NIES-3585 TaxID=1973477 RepID=UPI000B5C724C|nr:S-layer homology domain-containing protein [Nodularia sp. NIES-3585]GAX37920.1 putative S-layer region-like protein [Nodularia sp. NIES-3585]